MKKRLFVLLMVLLAALSLWAGKYNDVGLTLGLGTTKVPEKELSFSYGVTLGLTNKLEMNVWGVSDVLPQLGANTLVAVDVGYSLLGERNTGSKVSGVNINTVVTAGGFYSVSDGGVGVMVGISPLIVGSPSISKREHALHTNIGWDFVNRKLRVTMSLLDIDIYLKGTFRDFV